MANRVRQVYLDHIATTPLHPEVRDEMKTFLDRVFGNPMSLHAFGEEPRQAMEESRKRVADLIHGDPREIIFASCGTEANNMAIKGIALAYEKRGRHIITSRVEHSSVLHSCRTLENQGFQVTYLPVDRHGMVDPNDVAKSLSPDTVLVSMMCANSEIGTLQPIKEIARLTREHGAVFHTDAIAAVGRIPVDVEALGVDALSLAGNQFYGPPGVAALFLRRGVRFIPLLEGGIQESGRRAGSENLIAIAGLGKAAEIARRELPHWQGHLTALQERLIQGLEGRIDRMILTGHPIHRLPGHVSLCLEFIEGEAQLRALSQRGIACATGSACRDYTTRKVSHVLEALGLDIRLAQGSLVFTMGKDNTPEDIAYTLEVLPPLVQKLRSISPVYTETVKAQGH
jgi:cysteine desulfurase